MASISRTLSEPTPDPRRLVPELPASLAEAVLKALAKDRDALEALLGSRQEPGAS